MERLVEPLLDDGELEIGEDGAGAAALPDEASLGAGDSVAEVMGAAEVAGDDWVAVLIEAGEAAEVSSAGSAGADVASDR